MFWEWDQDASNPNTRSDSFSVADPSVLCSPALAFLLVTEVTLPLSSVPGFLYLWKYSSFLTWPCLRPWPRGSTHVLAPALLLMRALCTSGAFFSTLWSRPVLGCSGCKLRNGRVGFAGDICHLSSSASSPLRATVVNFWKNPFNLGDHLQLSCPGPRL